ncbi:hypothetical protein TNCV_4480481 [Trichonephila clavipes]|nr:hypothetical protein TNCV_4480481 [Trichonephila clavipes]
MDALRAFHSAANGVEWNEWAPNEAQRTDSVVLWFMMWMRDLLLSCTQSTCHFGQWCNKAGAISPVGLSFPPASSDDRYASQLLGFVQHVDRFL